MDVKQTIREFITGHFLKGSQAKPLGDDGSFLEDGIIDSVGMLELVAFIEETYDVRVEDEELVPENLDSVNKLVVYVRSKLAAVKA
jgi:acyl carrier protein